MRYWCMPAIVMVAISAWPGVVVAADDKPVNMEVWSIRATTKNSEISPELKGLAATLKKQFKYTGFKLEKKTPGRAAIGKSFSATLIGGYKATVTPKSRSGKKVQLKVVATKGGKTVVNTTYTVDAGKLFASGVGPLDGGDYLIIAVRRTLKRALKA